MATSLRNKTYVSLGVLSACDLSVYTRRDVTIPAYSQYIIFFSHKTCPHKQRAWHMATQREDKATWSGPLQWRHDEHHGILNHRRLDCLLNRLFRCRSKKTSKLRVTGLCEGNSPVTGEFPAERASNAENVSMWRRYHELISRQKARLFPADNFRF